MVSNYIERYHTVAYISEPAPNDDDKYCTFNS
jgi:hypothetical protein